MKRIAMLYVHLPAAELQFKEILAPAFKEQGAEKVWIEPYPMDSTDFKSLALKVKAFNPDLIVLNGFIPHVVSLVRDLRHLRLIQEGNTLISLDMLEAADKLTPEQLEGIIVAAPEYLTSPDNKELAKWRKSFTARFGDPPNYHSAFAYDMTLSIAAAADNLPSDASRQDWLNALRAVDITGITGKIEFDNDGCSKTVMNPAIYRNGKLELLSVKE